MPRKEFGAERPNKTFYINYKSRFEGVGVGLLWGRGCKIKINNLFHIITKRSFTFLLCKLFTTITLKRKVEWFILIPTC